MAIFCLMFSQAGSHVIRQRADLLKLFRGHMYSLTPFAFEQRDISIKAHWQKVSKRLSFKLTHITQVRFIHLINQLKTTTNHYFIHHSKSNKESRLQIFYESNDSFKMMPQTVILNDNTSQHFRYYTLLTYAFFSLASFYEALREYRHFLS